MTDADGGEAGVLLRQRSVWWSCLLCNLVGLPVQMSSVWAIICNCGGGGDGWAAIAGYLICQLCLSECGEMSQLELVLMVGQALSDVLKHSPVFQCCLVLGGP